MKIAIVGSRTISDIKLDEHISATDEIVSGGANGVDTIANKYASANGIKITEFLPNYKKYGRAAPIIRNREIVDYSDKVVVFWDGTSKGSLSVIKYAKKVGKPCVVCILK